MLDRGRNLFLKEINRRQLKQFYSWTKWPKHVQRHLLRTIWFCKLPDSKTWWTLPAVNLTIAYELIFSSEWVCCLCWMLLSLSNLKCFNHKIHFTSNPKGYMMSSTLQWTGTVPIVIMSLSPWPLPNGYCMELCTS